MGHDRWEACLEPILGEYEFQANRFRLLLNDLEQELPNILLVRG